MVPGVKPHGGAQSSCSRDGARSTDGLQDRRVPDRTRPRPPPASGRRQEGGSGVSRARDQAAAAGGNAGGDLVADGAERFSGPDAAREARGSGGGVGRFRWSKDKELAPAASPPPPKKRAASPTRRLPPVYGKDQANPAGRCGGEVGFRVGASSSRGGFGREEGFFLPAVLEKAVAAKGGASAADLYPHCSKAMVERAPLASVVDAGFLEISGAGASFRGRRAQFGKKRLESLAAQDQELEEGEIADTWETTHGMITNDFAECQELEEGEIAATMDNVEDMSKKVLDGAVGGHRLEEGLDIANRDALYESVEGQGSEEGGIAATIDNVESMRDTVQQSQISVHVTGSILRMKIKPKPPVEPNHMSHLVTLDRPSSSTSATARNTMETPSIHLASTSAFASKEKRKFESVFVTKDKLKGKDAVYLKDDDTLMAVALHEGKLELCKCRNCPVGGGADRRVRVRMIRRRFQFLCRFLVQEVKQGRVQLSRVDIAAENVIKKLPDYIKYGSTDGEIEGVEVGDKFLFRAELAIVGLHNNLQAGIDTTKHRDGELIAVSIVASGGYLDEYSSSGELVYIGSGGKAAGTDQEGDQKLERGNLALQNCIDRNIRVRVTHGFKTPNIEDGSHCIGKEMPTFIYDGLYHVVRFWQDGEPGARVFKYKLTRAIDQPELPPHVAKLLQESVVCLR